MKTYNLKAIQNRIEKKILDKVAKECNNNRTKMANMLGVTRPTLYDLLAKHN